VFIFGASPQATPPWRQKATEADICRQKAANFSPLNLPASRRGHLEISQPQGGWIKRPTTPHVPQGTTDIIRFNCQRAPVAHTFQRQSAIAFLSTKALAVEASVDAGSGAFQPRPQSAARSPPSSTVAPPTHNVKKKLHNSLIERLKNPVAIQSEDSWVLARLWRRSMPAAA
jgi:hypothetical protein